MASTFQIQGPVLLQWDPTNDIASPFATFTELGRAGNDDLFSVDIEYANNVITSTDTGAEPVEAVFTGMIAVVTCVLNKWDTAQIDFLQRPPGVANRTAPDLQGQAGVIGTRWITGEYYFAIQFEPVIASQSGDRYTFHRCILNGPNAVRFFDYGNLEEKCALQFLCFRRDPTTNDNILGDGSDGTERIYTKLAV